MDEYIIEKWGNEKMNQQMDSKWIQIILNGYM